MIPDKQRSGVDSAIKIMLHLDDRLWLLTVPLPGNTKRDAERLLDEGTLPCARLRIEIMDLFEDGTALAWRAPEGMIEQGKLCHVAVDGKERDEIERLIRRGITPVVSVEVEVLSQQSEATFTVSALCSPVMAGDVTPVLAYDV